MKKKMCLWRRLFATIGGIILAGGVLLPLGVTAEEEPTETEDTLEIEASVLDELAVRQEEGFSWEELELENGSKKTERQVVEEAVYQYLSETLKLNTAAICGILANIQEESNFNPVSLGDSGTSYGLFQWHNTRYTRLKEYCKKHKYDYKTVYGQLRYLNYELQYDGYKHVLQEMRKIPNTAEGAYQAAYTWCIKFEIPSNKKQKAVARGKIAKSTYWKKYHG